MASKDNKSSPRFTNRTLAILAGVVWVAVLVMVSLYFTGPGQRSGAAGLASGGQGDTPNTAGAQSTTSPLSSTTTSMTVVSTTSTTTPSPTSTSTTTSSTTSTTLAPRPLTVAAGGDVLGDRRVGAFIDDNGGRPVLAPVAPSLESADIAFVNLEGPVSDKGTRNPFKQYTFRARPRLIDGLTAAGIDVVSLANNHTLDYGPAALLDTIARLDKAGIAHAGAGANATAAQAPALLQTPAGLVAVLAFTEIIPGGFGATAKQPGVNPVMSAERKKLLALIASAGKKADFVIVSFHWGTEYTRQPSEEQRTLAHQAVDAGADLVLGHHPHVIQGLELYRNRLIAYSLGDFVFDHYSRETGEAFVLRVALPPAGSPSIEVVPVYLRESNGVPSPVTGQQADTILTRLTRLSAALGLELSRSGDRALYGTWPAAGAGEPPKSGAGPGTTATATP